MGLEPYDLPSSGRNGAVQAVKEANAILQSVA